MQRRKKKEERRRCKYDEMNLLHARRKPRRKVRDIPEREKLK